MSMSLSFLFMWLYHSTRYTECHFNKIYYRNSIHDEKKFVKKISFSFFPSSVCRLAVNKNEIINQQQLVMPPEKLT